MSLPIRARVFVALLVILCVVSLGYAALTFPYPTVGQLGLFGVFSILAVLSEIYATWIPIYKWEISSSIAIYLSSLFILGPSFAVILIFIASLVSELFLRWDRLEESFSGFIVPVAFNTSQLVLSISLAGLILSFSGHQAPLLQEPGDYFWALMAFLTYALLNLSLVTGVVFLTGKKGFFYALWRSLREFSLQYLVLCVSALLLTVLYSISVWHVSLALIPLTLVHVSFRSYLRLQTEARRTFEKISRILDERDHYTAVHSSEVADLAVKIAREMGLPQGEIEKVDIAARVHDIGKIAVPDSILFKPGSLNEEEWAVMKRHPVISAELIEGLEIYTPVANAVRHEHERWNGSGYPDGLKGNQIPRIARIIAAADIYNALSTDRPYRKAFSHEKTIEMIKDMRGTDLDPAIADALLCVIALSEDEPSPDASPLRDE